MSGWRADTAVEEGNERGAGADLASQVQLTSPPTVRTGHSMAVHRHDQVCTIREVSVLVITAQHRSKGPEPSAGSAVVPCWLRLLQDNMRVRIVSMQQDQVHTKCFIAALLASALQR